MKNIIKKSICYLLVTMLLIASSSTTILAIDYYPSGFYIANYETMNVRSGPGLNYPVVGILKKGEKIFIHDTSSMDDGKVWGAFTFNGSYAFARMDGEYLLFSKNDPTVSTANSGNYRVAYQSMNVRSGPGLNYPVVGTLYKDQGVYVWGTITIDGVEWGRINISGGEDFDVYVRITGGYLVRE